MKTQVWVYIAVVILSVGAGVAIAGVPDTVSQDPTIQISATSEAPDPEPDPSEPADTEPADTEPAATEPAATDASGDDPPVTTVVVDPTTSTSTTTTSTTTTTTEPPAPTTTVPLPDRADVDLSVVNAANVGGAANRTANFLEDLGYVDVGSFDGIEIVDVTVVFAAEGLQGPADRVADELGIDPGLVFPIGAIPTVDGLGEAEVVVYLGRDVVDLPFFA